MIMTATVVFAIRLRKKLEKRVKIATELNSKVSELRETASKTVEKPAEDLDLVYLGVPLKDENTLAHYSFVSGRTIHVLTKYKPKAAPIQKSLTSADYQRFSNAIEEYGHKNIQQKFPRKEILKKVITDAPHLGKKLYILDQLLDPDILLLMSEPDALKQFIEKHPQMADALEPIMAYLKENPVVPDENQASTSSGNAYSLDALSDDESTEHNARRRQSHPLTRNDSNNAITTAQLSAAIANARNFSSTGAVLDDGPNVSASGSTGSRPVITSDMFGSALRHAFENVSGSSQVAGNSRSERPPAASSSDESLESLRTRLQPQLQQMRDMGLLDETQNIRALQINNGDLQAAIEMVFGNDIDMNF